MILNGTRAIRKVRTLGSTIKLFQRHRPSRAGVLRIDRVLIGLAAAFILPSSASSYEINPLKDRHQGAQLAPPWMKKFDTVHEDMTYAAVACANGFADEAATVTPLLCRSSIRQRSAADPGNIHNALIVGLWWNDDPDHFAYANALLPGVLSYLEMKQAAKRARASGGRPADRRSDRMIYRSHYGDLAFLHGMATANLETPEVTQQKIIHWMNFAYRVAIAQIAPNTAFGNLDHPVSNLFKKQPSMTVGNLFQPRRRMAHLSVRELALGSMLHLLQDSFAAGHTARANSGSGKCADGRVSQFQFYLRQVSARHLGEDSRGALLQNISRSAIHVQTPVDASAQILLFARARADWATVVEPYLRATLFCIDETSVSAGPGTFMPARERAYELAGSGECGEIQGLVGIRFRLTMQGFPAAGRGGIDQGLASRRHGSRLAALCNQRSAGEHVQMHARASTQSGPRQGSTASTNALLGQSSTQDLPQGMTSAGQLKIIGR